MRSALRFMHTMKSIHNKDLGLLLIRLAVGAVFVVHGYQKLTMWGMLPSMFEGMGVWGPLGYVAALIEFFGGISLIIGFGSKVAGLLLACVMAVAAIKIHLPAGFSVAAGGYEFVLALLGSSLGLALIGPGKYSAGSSCGCPVGEGKCPMDSVSGR